ncbi:glycosyltransferase [bacterium]|nr:glycosyltransferase [bacterium]
MEAASDVNLRGRSLKDLSVIIVSYNAREFLAATLESVFRAGDGLDMEVFVVDNASSDGAPEMVRERFPQVTLMAQSENLGFAKANNLALADAQGRYLMILNPDCILQEDTLTTLVRFMDEHPESGASGPKLLNRDGSFQVAAKRGLPTPWVAFCKLSGLSTMFPRSKAFNYYELGHLDPDEVHEVESLTGAAMMVRREAYEAVGGLDEDYFMFGEDIDWCYSISKAGWKVHYVPTTQIIHYKGESTRRSDTDRERHFYNAMRIFARKHFAGNPISTAGIEIGIYLSEIAARLRKRATVWVPMLIDFIIILVSFVFGYHIKFGEFVFREMYLVSVLYALITLGTLSAMGVYRGRGHRPIPILLGMFAGFAIVSTSAYFVKSIAFSRLVIVGTAVAVPLLMLGWRGLVRMAVSRPQARRAVVIGLDDTSRSVMEYLQNGRQPGLRAIGWLVYDPKHIGESPCGLPVLGLAKDFAQIAEEEHIEEAFFSSKSGSYEKIVKLVSANPAKGVNVQVIPEGYDPEGDVPLLELDLGGPLLSRLANPRGPSMRVRKR